MTCAPKDSAPTNDVQRTALALVTCSAGLCMRCEHWEKRDAMQELGYVPSAAIACIRSGRKFVGIERDPAHYQTALERIQRELSQGDLFLDSPNSKR